MNETFSTTHPDPAHKGQYTTRFQGYGVEGAAKSVFYFEELFGPIRLEQTPLGLRVFQWETPEEPPQHKPVTRQEFEDAITSITVEEKMSQADLVAVIEKVLGFSPDLNTGDDVLKGLDDAEVANVFRYLENRNG